jgi:hypothetical protein
MTNTHTLEFSVHVRTGTNALISVSIDDNAHIFELEPTINWVPSSSPKDSHKVPVQIIFPKGTKKVVNLKISVENSDVLICGYEMSGANFVISSQPRWNAENWQPYDISGHGNDAEYHGNGSLQILAGQTVEFNATVF